MDWDKEEKYNPVNLALDALKNREKFSYDVNADMLYQQYKDSYVNQGKQAAMDVMGKASAMTGGYGNSYAQTVGQQTYQGYLQGLNDKVPELYQLALDRYNAEGQDLLNNYALEKDKYDTAYTEFLNDQSETINSLTSQNKALQGVVDQINVDENGDLVSFNNEEYNKKAQAKFTVTTEGFEGKENKNFHITFNNKKYYVENHGKVEDDTTKEKLNETGAKDGDCVFGPTDDKLYYKSGGEFYIVGNVALVGKDDYEDLRDALRASGVQG